MSVFWHCDGLVACCVGV